MSAAATATGASRRPKVIAVVGTLALASIIAGVLIGTNAGGAHTSTGTSTEKAGQDFRSKDTSAPTTAPTPCAKNGYEIKKNSACIGEIDVEHGDVGYIADCLYVCSYYNTCAGFTFVQSEHGADGYCSFYDTVNGRTVGDSWHNTCYTKSDHLECTPATTPTKSPNNVLTNTPTDGPTTGPVTVPNPCVESGYKVKAKSKCAGEGDPQNSDIWSIDDCLAWCDFKSDCVGFTFVFHGSVGGLEHGSCTLFSTISDTPVAVTKSRCYIKFDHRDCTPTTAPTKLITRKPTIFSTELPTIRAPSQPPIHGDTDEPTVVSTQPPFHVDPVTPSSTPSQPPTPPIHSDTDQPTAALTQPPFHVDPETPSSTPSQQPTPPIHGDTDQPTAALTQSPIHVDTDEPTLKPTISHTSPVDPNEITDPPSKTPTKWGETHAPTSTMPTQSPTVLVTSTSVNPPSKKPTKWSP